MRRLVFFDKRVPKGTIKNINIEIDKLSMTGVPELTARAIELGLVKVNLLTNGNRPPVPARAMNQRQRRRDASRNR